MNKESKVVNNLDSWLSPVINSFMTYKGQRESIDDLPKTDNRLGDVYYITSESKQYAYNGMNWELIDDSHGSGGDQSFVNYKGVKDKVESLPVDGNEAGDAWYVMEDSSMYMWNGESWESLGVFDPPMASVDWDDITNKPDVFYVHPDSPAGEKESGLYKIATDMSGHVTDAISVTKEDLTGLGMASIDDISDIDAGVDEAIRAANQAVDDANMAVETAKNLPSISGGYGPPTLGGVAGDLYVDYNTGDIYEFGNNDTV